MLVVVAGVCYLIANALSFLALPFLLPGVISTTASPIDRETQAVFTLQVRSRSALFGAGVCLPFGVFALLRRALALPHSRRMHCGLTRSILELTLTRFRRTHSRGRAGTTAEQAARGSSGAEVAAV